MTHFKVKQLLVTLAALIIIPVMFNLILPPEDDNFGEDAIYVEISEEKQVQRILSVVGVININPSNHQSQLKAYGEVKPAYEVQLSAEVSGRVVKLDKKFASGQIVKRGERLLSLDDTSYQHAYLAAKKSLVDAQISLLEEERKNKQAVDDWERSGLEGKPNSPLVLNEPQLKAAEINVEQHKAMVAEARRDLSNVKIVAPFDALVVKRNISPGSFVQVGSEVGTLYSTNLAEIRILLSDAEWQLLPSNQALMTDIKNIRISLEDKLRPERNWSAKVLRVEQHIEAETRQRALILGVENPLEKDLLPGAFVQANISGKIIENSMSMPASALSQKSEIWYVDKQNLLQRFSVTPLFTSQGTIIITPPVGINNLRVVLRPLASYKQGMKVEAKQEPAA